MKPAFWDYVREAFNARPIGMFVPPNWVGLGVIGLLGLLNPGFLVLGAGVELAYLGLLANNPRFQRWVQAVYQSRASRNWQARINDLVGQLSPEGQRRYRTLEVRCRAILEHQYRSGTIQSGLESQGEGLGRLLWVYLRMLLMRHAVEKIVRESTESPEDSEQLGERLRG
ncbi:MAG: hypothetical protein HXY20_05670, partial [Acidobacteria bacterium]|nr:hypothetical protein [Acidobacteriota bacterium]